MSLTITIPGAVNVTTGAMAPAVLTVGVGVPGAQGPQGPAGQGVPVGGTAGQYLQKIDGTNYNTDWVTVNLGAYAVKANNLSDLTNFATARDNLNLGTLNSPTFAGLTLQGSGANVGQYTPTSLTLTHASSGSFVIQPSSGITFPDTSVQTTAFVAGSGLPTGGTVGQVLTKNSGSNFDASFQTLIPGDRYLTTSTTSNTLSNTTKTFTIGTGLSYTPTQNITISYDASNHMHGEVLTYNSGTGVLTVDVNHHTGSGTYTAWVVNVGGVTPATSVAWGAITGTLSSQTDLQSAIDAKLAVTTAASTYAPIASPTFTGTVTIPAGASISGFASLASPDFTGNVTINSSTGSALFITQTGTGNILTLHDQASDTTFVAIDANGKVNTIASETTNGAGFNIAHGAAPTTPVNGDIWTTTGGLFMRQNGTTKQYVDFDTSQTINGSKTFSNATLTLGNSTATGTISVASGATISASTKTVNIGTGGVVGSTTNITVGPVLGASTTSIGNTTAASTLNLATGATLTGTTKAVNIGTAGVAGSTTNIAIGSTTGTSTTTLQGTTNGVTAAADTNSVALATTAYVVGQASAVAPSNDAATAAVGTSLRYARADHVHLNPLPAGGSANQVLAKVDATSYNTQWVTPSGGGGGTDYQAYETAGTFTWTKPAGAKWVEILMFGGGGGGGSGTRQATATARSGGGGGAGGAYAYLRIAASSLGATQSVVVGAAGTAGTAITVDATVGNAGGSGGESSFFGVRAVGGGGGGGGTTGTGSNGAGRSSFNHGQSTAISSTAGGAGVAGAGQTGLAIAGTSPNFPATGGGGGGGAAAASTTSATGGTGGQKVGTTATQSGYITTISGGTGGTTAGVSPTSGVSFLTSGTGSTGSGGGAYITAVAGMAGAVGTAGGGGGGGGAASDNGFASGAGGAGGAGAVFIITYC